MARNSYRYTKARVEEILKMLSSQEERDILNAYIADQEAEAAKARPVSDFARGLGVVLPFAAGLAGALVYGISQIPEPQVPECEECEVCEVCPEPAGSPDWSKLMGRPLWHAETQDQSCYWHSNNDVMVCVRKRGLPEQLPEPVE